MIYDLSNPKEYKEAQEFINTHFGLWEITKPQRTAKQNLAIHAIFVDAAKELEGIGTDLAFGNFQASWTPIMAKELFKQCYLGGKRTSECDTREISNAMDLFISNINSKGGQLSINNYDKIL